MLIGPDNFTRPPASQRQRWDDHIPLERIDDRWSRPQRMRFILGMFVMGALFWYAAAVWWLS